MYLALRFLRSFEVHVPLFLQMTDFTATTDRLYQTLLADKQEHRQKDKDGNYILAPFMDLYCIPEFRKTHTYSCPIVKIGGKVTKKLAHVQKNV